MNIQVIGSGCPTCKTLFERTQKAVQELHMKENVEYVTDVQKIVEMGLMQSPVLAINGQPVAVSYVPGVDDIKKLIQGTH